MGHFAPLMQAALQEGQLSLQPVMGRSSACWDPRRTFLPSLKTANRQWLRVLEMVITVVLLHGSV